MLYVTRLHNRQEYIIQVAKLITMVGKVQNITAECMDIIHD